MLQFFGDLTAWQLTLFIIDYSIKIVAVGVVPENRHPSSSTAWLLVILLLPFVGLPLFLAFGSQTITGRRHRVQAMANKEIVARNRDLPDTPPDASVDPELANTISMARKLIGMPAVSGDVQALHTSYASIISAMTTAVDRAEFTVHCQMYIFALDETTEPFIDALGRAKARGVHVRVLVDPIGSRKYPGYRKLKRFLRDHEIDWHAMLPINLFRLRWRRFDLRNHRKMLLIDGHTAFMGSLNMIEPEYQQRENHKTGRQWIDIMVELQGDIVPQLEAVFATDWASESVDVPAIQMRQEVVGDESPGRSSAPSNRSLMQILPSGPGYTTEPNLRVFNDLLYMGTERVSICSPYFVPDESFLMSMTSAAYAGVEVELFVNEKSDHFMVGHAQCSYYYALLEAGVKIYLYPAPMILHSKFMVVDNKVAVMGSSNMDMRSFGLNYEVTLLSSCGDLVPKLRTCADEYRAASRLLTLEEWKQRNWGLRYLDNVLRMTSALQ